MSERVEEARRLLTKLKERMVAGALDRSEFEAQRDLILADFSAVERGQLGVTTPPPGPTGSPTATRGFGPSPGPSGGAGGGLHTSMPRLSELALEPGTVLLGQWQIVREIGRGGFGAVFEAEETNLHERQAVKVLDPGMVAREELLARFRREVSLMRRLIHPRIVRVFDYREDLPQLVALISMELVTGGPLRDLVGEARGRSRPVPAGLARTLLAQALEALVEAHRQGVIHRDVTPSNILLAGGSSAELLARSDRDPLVKLVDFGIAGLAARSELSQKSRVLGTAAYVAPEVLDPQQEITPAADLYSLGAVGYELVTGELPLGRFANPRDLRPELPADLDELLLALLARAPGARPSAVEALRRVTTPPPPVVVSGPPAAPSPVAAPLPATEARAPGAVVASPAARPAARRNSLPLLVGAGALIVAVAAGLWMSRSKGSTEPPSPGPLQSAPKATAPAPAPAPAREDPAEVERRRAQAAAAEKLEQERKARERVARYVDATALADGMAFALATDARGKPLPDLTAELSRAIGAGAELLRPAFLTDGLFRRAAAGDRGVLSEVGLGDYPGDLLLVTEESSFASDRMARDLMVATVHLSGRLYRDRRGVPVQGNGQGADFNRDKALAKARTAAVAELVSTVVRSDGN